jgi:hypothetical protein
VVELSVQLLDAGEQHHVRLDHTVLRTL